MNFLFLGNSLKTPVFFSQPQEKKNIVLLFRVLPSSIKTYCTKATERRERGGSGSGRGEWDSEGEWWDVSVWMEWKEKYQYCRIDLEERKTGTP